jgi:2-polyprenyl-6-methoxyphenol hydroxylase-like FAD-dependent oxidoreductase
MTHAIVIGGSVAGLLAAAALAKTHERVTVFERDDTAPTKQPRRGVPQGKHTHLLLQAGENAIEELLPGTRAQLVAEGAHRIDFGRDAAWFHYGVWKQRHESGFYVHAASRPLVEFVLRERVSALQPVSIRRGEVVEGLVFDDTNERVVGVRVKGSIERADVVVEASGRGTLMGRWLELANYPAPPEIRVRPNLRYATRQVRVLGNRRDDWKLLVVYPEPPAQRRLGLIFPIEGDRWSVTLGGWCGDHPTAEPDEFLAFARSLAHPAIGEILSVAEPLGDVFLHPFPEAVWRRWDHMGKLPRGLAVVGDAACSFDPVFGQGMAVAALEARLLSRYLDKDATIERPKKFFAAQAKVIATPWLLSTSEDLRFPEVTGPRASWLSWLQAYTRRVFRLCATDIDVHRRFLRVLHLVDGPEALFAPSVLAKVIRASLSASPTLEMRPVPTLVKG